MEISQLLNKRYSKRVRRASQRVILNKCGYANINFTYDFKLNNYNYNQDNIFLPNMTRWEARLTSTNPFRAPSNWDNISRSGMELFMNIFQSLVVNVCINLRGAYVRVS